MIPINCGVLISSIDLGINNCGCSSASTSPALTAKIYAKEISDISYFSTLPMYQIFSFMWYIQIIETAKLNDDDLSVIYIIIDDVVYFMSAAAVVVATVV